MTSSIEHDALFEMAWMIPSAAAARKMFTSPPGWPRRASAVGATKMGSEERKERIFVSVETSETLFSLWI